jgi:hypothetical protein
MEQWEIETREGVRLCLAAYTSYADRGKFEEVAALFAPDGVLEVEGIGGARVSGPEEILAFFRGVNSDVVTAAPPGRMQHHVSSTSIEVTSPTEARASSYFTVMTGAGVDHWGTYRDRLVPHDGRWVFAHRHVRTDGVTPGGWADARRSNQ